jgi:hypothetical protein
MTVPRSQFIAGLVFSGLLATGCGGGDGDSTRTASPASPRASSAPASAASATPGAGKPAAEVPRDCADERLIGPLAKLIKGKKRGATTAKQDELLCSWGEAVPGVTVTVRTASSTTTSNDSDFPVVDIPELKRIPAQARAKVTQIALGSKKLYISTYVVTSDQLRISVAYTAEKRRDQDVGDAAVAMAERLNT